MRKGLGLSGHSRTRKTYSIHNRAAGRKRNQRYLRNAIHTILSIPEGLTQTFGIPLNDKNDDIIVRNTIILLLALSFPNGEASEVIIHLWYSTAITTPMALFMKEALAPNIKEFYNSLPPSTDPRRVVGDE
jgi:hypothetical protein